jgi:hypothetical protein
MAPGQIQPPSKYKPAMVALVHFSTTKTTNSIPVKELSAAVLADYENNSCRTELCGSSKTDALLQNQREKIFYGKISKDYYQQIFRKN